MTYGKAEVASDTPVTVVSGQPTTFVLGGVTYDVLFDAESAQVAPGHCGWATNRARIDVRAQDLAERAVQLPTGTLPACSQGNDPSRTIYFYLEGPPAPWAAEVVYVGYVSYIGHQFGLVQADPSDGQPIEELRGHAQEVLPAPEIGAPFWLSVESDQLQALFESEGGPLVVARDDLTSPSPGPLPDLEALLGVGVTLEVTCAYDRSTNLWDVVFATEPPVRVATGTIETITIGGRNYHVWLGGGSITIYQAD